MSDLVEREVGQLVAIDEFNTELAARKEEIYTERNGYMFAALNDIVELQRFAARDPVLTDYHSKEILHNSELFASELGKFLQVMNVHGIKPDTTHEYPVTERKKVRFFGSVPILRTCQMPVWEICYFRAHDCIPNYFFLSEAAEVGFNRGDLWVTRIGEHTMDTIAKSMAELAVRAGVRQYKIEP